MSKLTDFSRSLRGIIRTELGLADNSVRPANQPAPVGGWPSMWATVYLTQIGGEGWAERTYKDDATPATTVSEELEGMQRVQASIQFYREDALYLAHKLNFRINATPFQQKLQAAHMGFISAGPVRDLTQVIDEAWEERAQLDFNFYVVAREVITLTTIGSMQPTFIRDQPASITTTPEIILS